MALKTRSRSPLRAAWKFVFKPAARYPADPRAVFILALSVFTGLSAILLDQAPQTLDALMPFAAVAAWGILLTAGSAMTLIGMARQTPGGIVLEQIGSVMVGATTCFYSILAIYVVGPTALQPVGIILAWGVSCFIRWLQLQALVHESLRISAVKRFDRAVGVEVERREAL